MAMRNEAGFTLIEIVVSLVLVGILALTAGLWLITGMQGYATTRENVTISQKGHLAGARLSRELSELTEIDRTNSNAACIVYRVDALSPFFRVVTLRGNELVMKTDESGDCNCTDCEGAGTHVLVDQVNAFQVAYEDSDGNSTAVPPVDLESLALMHIQFDLFRADGEATIHAFALNINPRNNLSENAP